MHWIISNGSLFGFIKSDLLNKIKYLSNPKNSNKNCYLCITKIGSALFIAASCPPGLVFKECYKHTCEPCCAELMTPDACPETNECFPGCYCPDGYVRRFEECVRPVECRDCKDYFTFKCFHVI